MISHTKLTVPTAPHMTYFTARISGINLTTHMLYTVMANLNVLSSVGLHPSVTVLNFRARLQALLAIHAESTVVRNIL